jgi:PAS domain S-box-containing protein
MTHKSKDKPENSDLRKEAEKTYNESHRSLSGDFDGLSEETVKELFHELKVHQIELEMQNDELRKTRDSLEISRSKYFDLYDLAPVGYLTLDNKGLILEANLTSANILGLPRENLVNQPFSRFINNEYFPVYFANQKKLLEDKVPQSYEIDIINSKGQSVCVLLEVNVLQFGESSQICRVIMSDIAEYKLAQKKITELLKEKELVLKEVHHRIKNNLNTVMSILSIHSNHIVNPEAIAALQDAKSRVNTMLVVYNKLYRSDNLMQISLSEYLTPLIAEIIELFPELKDITLKTSVDNIPINVRLLPTIGIIVNELLTNIAKYAFTGRNDGEIFVSASVVGDHIKLIVKDNGIGIEDLMKLQTSEGLGLQLVNLLTDQLNGKLTIDGENGTTFMLEFDNVQ